MQSAAGFARVRPPISAWARTVGTVAGLAAVYFVAAKLGLRLAFVHASATAVWPPTGISLAALLLLGDRAWPGIFLGAFLANITTAGSVATSIGIATGNTLEAVAGAYLVNRFARGSDAFRQAPDIFRFALLGAGLATMVSATVGVTSLSLGGFARWADYGPIWLTWWLGDATGALIVTPFILLWVRNPRLAWSRGRALEGLLFTAAFMGVLWVTFWIGFPLPYLTIPALVWSAFRFGLRGTASLIVILAGTAIWRTIQGVGPFAGTSPNVSLLLLQGFMGMMALVKLPVAAVVAEWRRADQRLRESEQRFRDLYHHERGISESLQRSLLPRRLPEIPGVAMVAHYVPAEPEAVGGDWYDVMVLPDGTLGLAIGDVAGRGPDAAAVMGKLRNALRAYALEGHPPGQVLGRLNQVMEPGEMATVLYLVLDLVSWKVRYSGAGHPPAFMAADGDGNYLEAAGLPLGTRLQWRYPELVVDLPPRSTLVLYTDGLIETRKTSVGTGLTRLRQAIREGRDPDLERMARQVVSRTLNRERPRDDVALLMVHVSPLDDARLHLRVPALPASLRHVRNALRRWTAAKDLGEDDVFAITVATGEACANAIEHAYGLADAMIEVEATDAGDEVRITVRDWGRWRPSRGGEERGRGFQVMKGFMDRVDLASSPSGTSVDLAKKVHRQAEG